MHGQQNIKSCNTIYPTSRNVVCCGYIIVNTLYKGDNKYNNNNNNNSLLLSYIFPDFTSQLIRQGILRLNWSHQIYDHFFLRHPVDTYLAFLHPYETRSVVCYKYGWQCGCYVLEEICLPHTVIFIQALRLVWQFRLSPRCKRFLCSSGMLYSVGC